MNTTVCLITTRKENIVNTIQFFGQGAEEYNKKYAHLDSNPLTLATQTLWYSDNFTVAQPATGSGTEITVLVKI